MRYSHPFLIFGVFRRLRQLIEEHVLLFGRLFRISLGEDISRAFEDHIADEVEDAPSDGRRVTQVGVLEVEVDHFGGVYVIQKWTLSRFHFVDEDIEVFGCYPLFCVQLWIIADEYRSFVTTDTRDYVYIWW